MLKLLKLASILLLVATVAEAQPVRIEFVSGDGFLRSSSGVTVQFEVDASQLGQDDPDGSFIAAFFSFPQHLFMVLESTEFTSSAVDKRTAVLTGTAVVDDSRSGFQGEVEFSAVFEDLNWKNEGQKNDRMSLTLQLPAGAEAFAGGIVPGGVEVGKRRPAVRLSR